MNWLIIIFAAVLLINIFFGAKNGLWNAGVTFVTLMLILFLMSVAMPSFIGDLNSNDEMLLNSSLNDEKDFGYFLGLFPDKLEEKILQGYPSYEELKKSDFDLSVRMELIFLSFGVISMALIALLFGLFVLRPLSACHDKLMNISVMKKLDKVIGVLFGIVNGVIIVNMLLVVIMLYSSTEFGLKLYEMIFQSDILMYLYKNNLLFKIVF